MKPETDFLKRSIKLISLLQHEPREKVQTVSIRNESGVTINSADTRRILRKHTKNPYIHKLDSLNGPVPW